LVLETAYAHMADVQKRQFKECSSLQQMMLIVFSRILRQRKYYDDSHFFQHQVHGATVFIIDWRNPFVDRTIPKSIIGAGSAADLRYVQTVQMLFVLLRDRPGHFVERYAIYFNDDNILELVSPSRRAPLFPLPDRSWNYDSIRQMSSSVDEICGNLDPLPPPLERVGGLEVRFRIDYNLNCPKHYQAPHFESSRFKTLYFSDLLPTQPLQDLPPPQRVLSSQDNRVRSTLSVQSLFTRRSSAPSAPSGGNNALQITNTDTSYASMAPQSHDDPQLAVIGNDEEEREEIEIVRGEDDGEERRNRSIDGEDEGEDKTKKSIEGEERRKRSIDGGGNVEIKKSRSSSLSSSPSDDPLKKLRRDFNQGDVTLLSTSLEVIHSTIDESFISSRSQQTSSDVKSPSEKNDDQEEVEDDQEKEEDDQEEEEEEDQ
ncbi:hypothetical protein PMAYCL1PPCAC_07731, partial [Pristionchus mayeri]